MVKIILAILLIMTGNRSFAQYLHYSDKTPVPLKVQPAKTSSDSLVYHEWPDRCPGMSGSIPVLTSYVPRELVLKFTEIFKGHLYSIASVKIESNKLLYKLKVCIKGEMKIEFADDTGNIVSR